MRPVPPPPPPVAETCCLHLLLLLPPQNPKHWEAACRAAFTAAHKSADMSREALLKRWRASWRRLFLGTPHVRSDGLYVSRNTYVRQGALEWRRQQTVHLVTYFRYFRWVAWVVQQGQRQEGRWRG